MSPSTRARVTRLFSIATLAALSLPACHRGPRDFTNENDRLRRENHELRAEMDELQKKAALREKELATLEAQLKPGERVKVEGAEVPRAVEVKFARYSGAIDTDKDGVDDTLRLYIEVVDQQGRFLPASGRAVVQVVVVRPNEAPYELASKTFEPKEFDAAYRSGLTGTHFTLEVKLPKSMPEGVDRVTVKLTFTDAATGATLVAERPASIKRN